MDRGPSSGVLRDVRTLYTLGTLGSLTDAELLERFLARGGDGAEDAFAALVHRHGPTVLGVCRRMLSASHDAEDAFQATFVVLARRAASIGRREKLANWLYGVAVRASREARRRTARARAAERRMMDVPRVESEPAEDRDDLLPMLDEELNRLPDRYRAALVACELEGKSRREAAQQLGIPEGTLSTHLARGRKQLRERLLRRGFHLGTGPITGLTRPTVEAAIPERLMGQTVRAAFGHAPGVGATATMPATVSSLAERVLKMMFLARLTFILAALMTTAAGTAMAVVFGLTTMTAESPTADPPKAGPNDLPGRVVDRSGTGVADVQVWAVGGLMYEPVTVVSATTDGQGRFILPHAWDHQAAKATGDDRLGLFARARDGRIGWLANLGHGREADALAEIELGPVGEVRGRVTDQDGRPIAGATVVTAGFWKPTDSGFSDYIALIPEVAPTYRTTTAADGTYALKGIPQGVLMEAKITAQGFGTPEISWNTTQAAAITLDRRVGRIQGRLKPPDAGGLSGRMRIHLSYAGPPGKSSSGPVSLRYNEVTEAGEEGSFRFDGLPPGRYSVSAAAEDDAPFVARPVEDVEVGPDAALGIEILVQRLVTISGRVVDARTSKGVEGVGVACYRIDNLYRQNMRSARTDAEGRYRVLAQSGRVYIEPQGLPRTYLVSNDADCPNLEVKADRAWPDLKLSPATELHGRVVDASGHPAAGAEVFLLAADRPGASRRREPIRTGPDGAFHFDQLDPDDKLSLWARAGDATTDGTVVVRPVEVKGQLTLAVDPKHAVRIRGLATDSNGRRIAGARVTLWWDRPYASEKNQRKGMSVGSVLETYTTGDNGWFVFRGLWPELMYNVVIEARGHNKAEAPQIVGKAGEAHDVGKIVLINTAGHVAGRVVGSDGRPIAGAAVFNRGDGPEPVATSTDPQGRFRLEGLFPGTRFVFVRKEGYRFTGHRADDDADGLTITLLRTGEPPPAWQPAKGPSYDEQRAFAKQVLIRIWEKYGARNNWSFRCIREMAAIDPDLALQWSAEQGHGQDDWLRHAEARKLAETDATGALGLLNQKPDSASQSVLQEVADRYADTDPKKALLFAEEAAVQSRGLNQPDRTQGVARAGAVLVKLGRADSGRKLIDEAARDAAQLPTANRAGYCRGEVARILAPYDLERARALIEPIQDEGTQRTQRFRADIAAAIATIDTKRAIEVVDMVGGNAFYHEAARTAIAYQIGAEQPNEAIRIIEGMRRQPATIWQAEAFGWLAVALAPRDRPRANALIDRALALMIDNRDWAGRSAWSGGELGGAAHVALRARRIGYPDMESVIMRVMAARPSDARDASSDRTRLVRSIAVSAVPLALVDPGAARTVLEQVESRSGFDPATPWSVREPWLIAWSLVDLDKARAIFDAELAALDREKEVNLWSTGFLEMVELLAAPPDRREDVLDQRFGGASWRPGGEL